MRETQEGSVVRLRATSSACTATREASDSSRASTARAWIYRWRCRLGGYGLQQQDGLLQGRLQVGFTRKRSKHSTLRLLSPPESGRCNRSTHHVKLAKTLCGRLKREDRFRGLLPGNKKAGRKPASLRFRDLPGAGSFVVAKQSIGTNNRLKLGDLTDYLSRPSRTKEAIRCMYVAIAAASRPSGAMPVFSIQRRRVRSLAHLRETPGVACQLSRHRPHRRTRRLHRATWRSRPVLDQKEFQPRTSLQTPGLPALSR